METIQWGAAEVQYIQGPRVYQFLLNEKPIYIGSSKYGLARVFSRQNQDVNRTRAQNLANGLRIDFYKRISDARQRERSLIKEHSPIYNYTGVLNRKRAAPLRTADLLKRIRTVGAAVENHDVENKGLKTAVHGTTLYTLPEEF